MQAVELEAGTGTGVESPDAIPSLDVIAGVARVSFNAADQALREARSSGESGLSSFDKKIAKLDKHAQFDSIKIDLIDETGVGEIRLSHKSKLLKITFQTDPAPEGHLLVEKLLTEFSEQPPGFGKGKIAFPPGNSIFKDSRALAVITALFESSTILGITGKNVSWRVPEVPVKGGDPFAIVRELDSVAIGFDPAGKSFAFRNVSLKDPIVGKHGDDDFLKDCEVFISTATEVQPANGEEVEADLASVRGPVESTTSSPILEGSEYVASEGHSELDESSAEENAESARNPGLEPSAASTIEPEGIVAEILMTGSPSPGSIDEKRIATEECLVFDPDPLNGRVAWYGACKEAQFVAMENGICTLQLRFCGSNLPGAGQDTAVESMIELSFSTLEMDERNIFDLGLKISSILQAQAEGVDGQAIEPGVSLSKHALVVQTLEAIDAAKGSQEMTRLYLENALIDFSDTPEMAARFSGATLGSSSQLLSASAYDAGQACISNCIIKNGQFAALTGEFRNSLLENLDLRSGQIDVSMDKDCSIQKISAIGALVSGRIDCEISGDFRSATLGSAERPLSGEAFAVTDGHLDASAFAKMHHFVVTPIADDLGHAILLNGEKISLNQVSDRVQQIALSALKENPEKYQIFDRIRDRSEFSKALQETSSIQFDDIENLITSNNDSYCARIVVTGGNVDQPDLEVSIEVYSLAKDERRELSEVMESRTADFILQSAPAEVALATIKQIANYPIEFEHLPVDELSLSFRKELGSRPDLMAINAAAAASAASPTQPHIDDREELVLNGGH